MTADPGPPPGLDDLTDDELRRIDQVCDGFENAWKSARRPEIERFLDGASGACRRALLRELVLLDLHYREQIGDSPEPGEYRRRFPELAGPAAADDLGAVGSSTGARDPSPTVAPEGPRRLGKFQLLERVGVGGFGTVWRARDVRLDRVVALKIPHAHPVGAAGGVARFYGEARAAAQLRHPGIVTVHEVADVDGLPILVCDFVAGASLRDALRDRRLGPREAAGLIARVADALAYAHAMGAVHRDIKPANIMLDAAEGPDGPGAPRIVDFGLAALDRESTHLTQEGAILGTPAYMSPEQAAGRDPSRPIDHRTDIYSLGVVLYELLAGTPPFAGTRSEVLNQVLASDPPALRRLDRGVPRDLESICLKAMAKEPRHRYADARELADDLRAFLEGEPVRARPVSPWRRLLRRAHRRPAEAAAWLMAAVASTAVLGLAVGYRYHRRLEQEFRATEAARRAVDRERRRAEGLLYFHRMALAEREWSANNIDSADRLLDDCPPHLRGWEWRYLKGQCHHERISIDHPAAAGASYSVTCVRFSPDGLRLASASKDGTVRLWEAATGRPILRLGRHRTAAFALAFRPDGDELASGGEDGVIRIWDARTGAPRRALPPTGDTDYALAYSPDGRLLASGHGFPPWEDSDHMRARGVARIWDATTGQVLRTLRGHTQNVMGVAFHPDGRTLASVSGAAQTVAQAESRPGELFLWSAATGELVGRFLGHAGPLTSVSYHPRGDLIVTTSWDRTIRAWDARTGQVRHALSGHRDWVLHAGFSPDGARIASAGADGAIKLWDAVGGRELRTLRGHTKNVTCVAFDPEGRRLASSSSDRTIKLWDGAASPEAVSWRGGCGPIARIAFFPDGHRLLVAGNVEESAGRVRRRLTILELAGEPRGATLDDANAAGPCRPVDGIAIRGDGRLVASASWGGWVGTWTVPDGRPRFRYDEPTGRFDDVALSPDGRHLAAGGQVNAWRPDGTAHPPETEAAGLLIAFDLEYGRVVWRAEGMASGIIRDLAYSPDGRTLATADNAGTVTLWESRTGRTRRRLRGHDRLASHVAFSPDGRRLASASWDSTVAIWDPESGEMLARLRGHMRPVLCVAFSPDGRRLATSSEDRTARLWDVETGQEVLTLHGHAEIVSAVAFSPDGNRLATAGADGVVLIREARPAQDPDEVRSGGPSTGKAGSLEIPLHLHHSTSYVASLSREARK